MEGDLATGSAPQAGPSETSSEEQLVCPRARISETLIGGDEVPYRVDAWTSS